MLKNTKKYYIKDNELSIFVNEFNLKYKKYLVDTKQLKEWKPKKDGHGEYGNHSVLVLKENELKAIVLQITTKKISGIKNKTKKLINKIENYENGNKKNAIIQTGEIEIKDKNYLYNLIKDFLEATRKIEQIKIEANILVKKKKLISPSKQQIKSLTPNVDVCWLSPDPIIIERSKIQNHHLIELDNQDIMEIVSKMNKTSRGILKQQLKDLNIEWKF